jgi:hypothetical protein
MKKEDFLTINNNCPLDITFIPESVYVKFEDKLKLQVAFYRGNYFFKLGNKICKTNPVKFLKSHSHNNKVNL